MTANERIQYFNVGEIVISPEPLVVSTVLGSCVAVCLFSPKKKVGGINHFSLPRRSSAEGETSDFRYGDVAIQTLIAEMERLTGETRDQFVAKIVGGADEVGGDKSTLSAGPENVRAAEEALREFGIPVIGRDTGGARGRKILFHTESGRLQVAKILPTPASGSAGEKPVSPAPIATSTPKRARRVMIVDDSRTIRELLTRVLTEDPEIEICAVAASGEEATKLLKTANPDVITLDINMPGMSGVEWLEQTLPHSPVPTVMISSLQLREGNEVFRALELGAVDYIQKPTFAELPVLGPLIREKVKEASFAKVMRHARPSGNRGASLGEIDSRTILAIGASTGGTEALKVVLMGFPDEIPPTVIVQHIPPVFSKAFADRLNEMCPFEVKEAEDGDEVCPSRVLIAPGGKQMKIHPQRTGHYVVRITDDAPVNRHKPSVDYLFHSVAEHIGKNCVGVILTGMGADGAKGLLELRQKGARTLAQDEASSVVYGMPKSAFEIGAAEKVVSLDHMSGEILTALRRPRKSA